LQEATVHKMRLLVLSMLKAFGRSNTSILKDDGVDFEPLY